MTEEEVLDYLKGRSVITALSDRWDAIKSLENKGLLVSIASVLGTYKSNFGYYYVENTQKGIEKAKEFSTWLM